MLRDKEILDALLAKLYMILNAGDTLGLTGAPKADSPFVSFLSPGMPISIEDLNFGFSPTSTDIAAASSFAELVDIIPNTSGLWSNTGRKLSDIYVKVLNGAILQPVQFTPAEKKELGDLKKLLYITTKIPDPSDPSGFKEVEADSPFSDKINTLRIAYQQEYANYNTLIINALTSPNDPKVLAQLNFNGPIYRDKVFAAYQKWKSAGGNIAESAQSRIDQLTGRDPSLTFADAKKRLNTLLRLDLNGQQYYFSKYFPTQFWTANNWTRYSFENSEIHTTDTSTSTSWGGGGGIGFGLWSIGANVQYSSQDKRSTSDASSLSLTVELARIPIRRSWFSAGILISKAWKADPANPISLSDGGIPPKGELPLYQTELIVARNLRIKMDMSSTVDTYAASQFSTSVSIGWGPFSLRGNYRKDTSTATHDFSYNSGEIVCPGMQIIGFACQTLPKAPDPVF